MVFLDIKGERVIVRCNVFNRQGNDDFRHAIATVYRADIDKNLDGDPNQDHAIHDNVFNMGDDGIPTLRLDRDSEQTYFWNNTINPEPKKLNGWAGELIEECCPDWYENPINCGTSTEDCVFKATDTNELFFKEGGSWTTTISMTGSYTVEQEGDWFTYTRSGNTFTVNVPYNGGDYRNGNIVIKGCENYYLGVTQYGDDSDCYVFGAFTQEKDKLEIDGTAFKANYRITSTTPL